MNKFLPILFVILFGFGTATKATGNECDQVSENPENGVFSLECINSVLINYVTYKPSGFFILSLSNEESIYVQGIKDIGNSFLFEAVGPEFTNALSSGTLKSLLNLGWDFPDNSSNYSKILQIDEIFSGAAAQLVFETLKSYDSDPQKVKFTYTISDL